MQGKNYYTEWLSKKCLLFALIVFLFISSLLLFQSQTSSLLGIGIPLRSLNAIGCRSGPSIEFPSDSKVRTRRLPHAIIIGTRKSGTRALLKFLEVNPSIRSASREIHFFDRQENYDRGLNWYANQMPETAEGELTIEKSPAYFVTKQVPERVKAMNASIKLIVIFRDPVTRLISDFSQLIANKLGPSIDDVDLIGDPIEAKSAEYLDTELVWQNAGRDFERQVLRPDGGVDEQRRMIKNGMYSIYLEKWLAVFPRSQFHFVDGERLIVEPHVELQKLERFLGVRPYIMPKHFVYNHRKGFYCLSGVNTTNKADANSRGLICLSKSKGRRHVVVNDDLKRELADFYAPYNEYLYSLTDINLLR